MIGITVDDREAASGIVEVLKERDWEVRVSRLSIGDYRLGKEAVVERKTARDFAVSIVDGRLFRQAARLKTLGLRTAILVEGSPLETHVGVDAGAVRGAIVSVSLIWQVPIIFTDAMAETVEILWYMAHQAHRLTVVPAARYGSRPKRLRRRQLFILQGLPGVGPTRAAELLARFGSLRRVFSASPEEWIETRGIGKERSRRFAELLDARFLPEV
jgi:Fanconi anemia group M protein